MGVLVDGDNNTVSLFSHGTELILDLRHRWRKAPQSELELLRTDLRAINLVGRDAELSSLTAWLNAARPIAVQCLIGGQGTGKTRLGIELCERAEVLGWTAGFASSDELKRFFEYQNLGGWRWSRPTLILIDDAASSARILREWLAALVKRVPRPEDQPLRFLLLERHADLNFGWWTDLAPWGDLSTRSPRELLDPPEPVVLGALTSLEDRRALLAQVMSEAAQLKRIASPPSPPASGTVPDFDRRLSEDSIGNEPLFLAMAGLVAVTTGASAALSVGRADLAERVAMSEAARLERLAAGWGLPAWLVSHLAAIITLEGGCDRDAALKLIAGETSDALASAAAIPADVILERLFDALAAPDGSGVDAMRPDFIGEAFLLQELAKRNRPLREQVAIIERAWRRSGHRVIATVIRTVQDFATDGREAHPLAGKSTERTSQCLAWFDSLVRDDDLDTLLTIARELPSDTVVLRQRAASIQDRIVLALEERVDREVSLYPVLADQACALSWRMLEAGATDRACSSALRGLEVYLALALDDPPRFKAFVPFACMGLSTALSAAGRNEEALAASSEALGKLIELAPEPGSESSSFLDALASAFNNCGNRLLDVGKFEEALGGAENAVSIRRTLVGWNNTDYNCSGLANALTNLGVKLHKIGRYEDGLKAVQEAVDLSERLAAVTPDAFLPMLANALQGLATLHSVLGSNEQSCEAARKSVCIYRALTAKQPDAFRRRLALALDTLSTSLDMLGNIDEALFRCSLHANHLFKNLLSTSPGIHEAEAARASGNLSRMLSEKEGAAAGLPAANECIALLRSVFAISPGVHCLDLARELASSAKLLSRSGDDAQAVPLVEEAIHLCENTITSNPLTAGRLLLRILRDARNRLRELSWPEGTLAVALTFTATLRQLVSMGEDHNRLDPVETYRNRLELAESYEQLGAAFSGAGRENGCILAQKIAIRHYEELAKYDPQTFFKQKIVTSAYMLTITLLAKRKNKEVVETCERVLPLRRELASQNPEIFGVGLVQNFLFSGLCRKHLGLIKLACNDFAEAAATIDALPLATREEAVTVQLSDRINSEYRDLCSRLSSIAQLGKGTS